MIFVLFTKEIAMRACFAGPNILALGYGVAVVQVPHRQDENPATSDQTSPPNLCTDANEAGQRYQSQAFFRTYPPQTAR